MRSLLAALAAVVLPCFAAVPAQAHAPAQEQAAGATVTVANMAFTPAKVRVGMGETVTWNFQDATTHTATSFPRGFFDTGTAANGASRTVRFPSAGVFDYSCRIHPMMRGKVRVPMAATGSTEDGWKLRWLVGTNPKGRTYDVQKRRKGTTTWSLFRHQTTTGSGRFDPGAGSWQVRARTNKRGVSSGWSPTLTLS
jgi:plastocyanin